ncbi:hypothetical protein RJT34_24594 [Clitoria ternatea]|uniref:Uncharacterized protein n=1 Tax=Clitoria ternatea TaxID=43366 RepID=A0AAN9FR13_CLITE
MNHVLKVDTNVGRIAVRLGWVPLQPLPEALQLHLLELYELHYQMITFGKVFCTKKKPNCNACPMRAECRHFASAFASARLALPGPEEKCIVSMPIPIAAEGHPSINKNPVILCLPENNSNREVGPGSGQCEPIIEEPPTPERWTEESESDIQDIEDFYREDTFEIYATELNTEESVLNVQNCLQEYKEGDMSRALVALTPQSASMPTPKLKNVSRLRTEHQVYELPDSHPLLEMMDKREPDDPSPYLLAIWSPGETANSIEPPESRCKSQDSMNLCNDQTCFSCNSIREANSQTVRGTLLLFADHASSIQPIDIPREWIWNLPRRTVYFGTSVSSIFKGYVCVRGFDQQARTPRPLQSRLHFIPTRSANTEKRKQG